MALSNKKKRVLFICTHNAARSQMAEGLLRALHGNRYEVFSAGTEPGRVSPYTIRVMAEIGIDIGAHHAKSLQEFLRFIRFMRTSVVVRSTFIAAMQDFKATDRTSLLNTE